MAATPTLYRRDDEDRLLYREAWTTSGGVIEHSGRVGTTGRQPVRPTGRKSADGATAQQVLERFEAAARADGFSEIPDEERGWVVLQHWAFTADLSHPEDERLFTGMWDALDGYLRWRGVGECDGNDVGGTPPGLPDGVVVNWFCPVVDVDLGVKALRSFARSVRMGSLHVIGRREPGEDSDYVLAYSPRKSDTTFTL